MKCGSHNHDEGFEEIPDADFIAAWESLRAWRISNPADALDANKVRTAVRDRLLPILPPPRDTSSQWWMMLCILSGDLDTNQTLAERKWIVWAYWGAIPPSKQLGAQPVPGEDF